MKNIHFNYLENTNFKQHFLFELKIVNKKMINNLK